jgi:hypothetical protein
MTFLTEAKEIISEFVSETKESLRWAKTEIVRQYHLSIIKEIKETYPTTYPYIDTVYKIVDGLSQNEDCPDFIEAPEPESDDGLNEPDYPYDNEPSA